MEEVSDIKLQLFWEYMLPKKIKFLIFYGAARSENFPYFIFEFSVFN